jgi:hypothetical protein
VARFSAAVDTLVDAARLGGVDAIELAFATQIGFKLGEHPEYVEEGLASAYSRSN